MKDIVMDRLGKMEDLAQRKALRNLMTSVFLNLTEYQEELNKKLEQRVFEEVGSYDGKHDIFVSMCTREDYDPLHEYLFPMLPEDVEPTYISLTDIAEGLSRGESSRLFTVFLSCSYSEIQALLKSKRTFTGKLVTDRRTYSITVSLEANLAYTNEIERLYRIFLNNGLPWKTVHHPYAYKFVNVLLTQCDGELGVEEEIREMSVHLEEFEPYKQTHLVPLWNIERLELKTGGFPVPAQDKVHFEHVLLLQDTGIEHGYLVDGDPDRIRYIRRTPEQITIVSKDTQSDLWNVLKLVEPRTSSVSRTTYPVVSNRQRADFLSNYVAQASQIVRSKGEIVRIVHSFEGANLVELTDISVYEQEKMRDRPRMTYELNLFLNDDVRVDHAKPSMVLTFRNVGMTAAHQYMGDDLLSFLVSQVQLFFPEYSCRGEWA